MNARFVTTVVIGVLACASAVQADTVCQKCEYIPNGRYLGRHVAGDRSTFQHSDIFADYGAVSGFDDLWVFDLDEQAVFEFSAKMQGMFRFGVTLHFDQGSQCFSDGRCIVIFDPVTPLSFSGDIAHPNLNSGITTGRFVLRIPGDGWISDGLPIAERASYSATITFKPLRYPRPK